MNEYEKLAKKLSELGYIKEGEPISFIMLRQEYWYSRFEYFSEITWKDYQEILELVDEVSKSTWPEDKISHDFSYCCSDNQAVTIAWTTGDYHCEGEFPHLLLVSNKSKTIQKVYFMIERHYCDVKINGAWTTDLIPEFRKSVVEDFKVQSVTDYPGYDEYEIEMPEIVEKAQHWLATVSPSAKFIKEYFSKNKFLEITQYFDVDKTVEFMEQLEQYK